MATTEKVEVVDSAESKDVNGQYKNEIIKLRADLEKVTSELESYKKAYNKKNIQFNNLVSIYNTLLEKMLNTGIVD